MRYAANNIIINIEKDQNLEIERYLEINGVKRDNIKDIIIDKKSIDSRHKSKIKYVYNIIVETYKDINLTNKSKLSIAKKIELPKRIANNKGDVVIVGFGPAGLFAALRLVSYGYKPIIIEQGDRIDDRVATYEKFLATGILNTSSNIQYGEGGAGTFSDGKLTTRIRSEYIDYVFDKFVEFGAPREILWEYKPHIGTDILRVVIANMRNYLISQGAKILFKTKMTDILANGDKIVGIEINNNDKIMASNVILALGNGARETFRMLDRRNISMCQKALAIGMRIEHLQSDIDVMQYGELAGKYGLEAATYNLTYNNNAENRGTFTFCMCPGGEIVNGASESCGVLTNGMSYSTRSGKFANSAVVVGIKENEFGDNLFANMELQESIERRAYDMVGVQGGIYTRVMDFIANQKSITIPETSYKMKLAIGNLEKLFPHVIVSNMRAALSYWSRNKYFINETTSLIGPETRTSSPVRILRDERGESISVKCLYPIGEGAGYAGGIVSSAVDGIKVVDNNFAKIVE